MKKSATKLRSLSLKFIHSVLFVLFYIPKVDENFFFLFRTPKIKIVFSIRIFSQLDRCRRWKVFLSFVNDHLGDPFGWFFLLIPNDSNVLLGFGIIGFLELLDFKSFCKRAETFSLSFFSLIFFSAFFASFCLFFSSFCQQDFERKVREKFDFRIDKKGDNHRRSLRGRPEFS